MDEEDDDEASEEEVRSHHINEQQEVYRSAHNSQHGSSSDYSDARGEDYIEQQSDEEEL